MHKIPGILGWWVGPIPSHYLKGNFLKTWFLHPVKRRIAKYYCSVLQNLFGLKIIGITGSVGKTTAKEMLTSILQTKYRSNWSFANVDPVYNIPTTILKTGPWTKMLILEMGVEYPGDMDFYKWMVVPNVGLLLNIFWTHTEFLGGISGVKLEKGKLIQDLPKNGRIVLNADDPQIASFLNSRTNEIVTFGKSAKAKIRAKDIKITSDLKTKFTLLIDGKELEIILPVLGEHFIYSALGAASVAYTQKVSLDLIKKGLESFAVAPHRMIASRSKNGSIILDDTYNSNPLGLAAAIDVLIEVGKNKKKVAVVGDMLELGEYTKRGHEEAGRYAASRGVDVLVCIGEYANYLADGAQKAGMKNENIITFKDRESGRVRIRKLAMPNSVVLFKASRKLGFEVLVEEMLQFGYVAV